MADMYVQKDLQQRTITKELIRRRQVHECAAENSIPLHRIELYAGTSTSKVLLLLCKSVSTPTLSQTAAGGMLCIWAMQGLGRPQRTRSLENK